MDRPRYVQLIDMKCWADEDLYEVVGQSLGQVSEQEATILVRILDHIHAVDRIFQHHLEDRPHGYKAARSEALPEFEALADEARDVRAWYADYVRSLTAEAFGEPVDFVFTSGKPARMTRGEILLHVCLHGTYHRGNAGAVLQLRGLTPSRDGITDYLEAAA
jgi:uncharacterized damage-inducible protein DinB